MDKNGGGEGTWEWGALNSFTSSQGVLRREKNKE
jgi:hypothetical protein